MAQNIARKRLETYFTNNQGINSNQEHCLTPKTTFFTHFCPFFRCKERFFALQRDTPCVATDHPLPCKETSAAMQRDVRCKIASFFRHFRGLFFSRLNKIPEKIKNHFCELIVHKLKTRKNKARFLLIGAIFYACTRIFYEEHFGFPQKSYYLCPDCGREVSRCSYFVGKL